MPNAESSVADPNGKAAVVGEIEEFLATVVAGMAEKPPAVRKRGHPTVLPALALWAGMLVCVLRGFNAQLALWRLLREQGVWDFPRYPITDQAVYTRLAKAAQVLSKPSWTG